MHRKPVCRSPFKLVAAILLVSLLSLLIPYSFMVGGGTVAAGGPVWTAMASGTTQTIYGVWSTSSFNASASNATAVAGGGTILHYIGSAWNAMTSGVTNDLFAIWGDSDTDMVTVGSWGQAVHYDGAAWSGKSTGTILGQMGVWGSSPTDVFMVGYYGDIHHYDGSAWSAMASPIGWPWSLTGVWGSSPTDVYAVGSAGIIIHYDGIEWTQVASGTWVLLNGIWGSSATDIFAVGAGGTILHNGGSGWTPMSSGTTTDLMDVWGSSATDVFAVGLNGTILHYNGSAWSAMSSGTTEELKDVWGSSPYDVFAVGTNGTILHYAYPKPTITTVSPGSAVQGQTLSVTITGANLDSATAVGFGAGVAVDSYTVESETQITAGITVSSTAAPGARDVTVTTMGGTATAYGGFTVNLAPPTISAVSPAGGKQGQTLTETITGAYLTGATAVDFGVGITVNSYTVNSATKITASITIGSSAATGTRDVSVTTPSGTGSLVGGFTVYAWYEQYTAGDGAASGVYSGSWLSQSFTPVTSHTLNTVSFKLYKVGSPTYTITIGLYAASADKPTGSALASTTFLASSLTTTAAWYEYQFPTGYAVTAGTKYALVLSATGGASGNMAYWRVNTAGTYSRGMKATSANQGVSWTTNSAHDFMFKEGGYEQTYPVPTITTVSPASGEQGETLPVTITGTDLTGATAVSFGSGIVVNSYTVDSGTQITASITISGAAATGVRDVSVTTLGGTGTLTGGFTVEAAPPAISAVNPASGGKGQTLSVVITGTGLTGATAVGFGADIAVNSYTVDSAVQITASITVSGTATLGARDVSVTAPGGTATLTGGFTVTEYALPIITGIIPASGIQGATLSVVITGSGLTGATAVGFGAGITVSGYTVDSDTQITSSIAIDGAAATGARDVQVTTAGGTATLTGGFAVNPASANGWYEQYTTGASAASGVMGTSWLAQTFTPMTSHTLDAVSLQLYKAGSPTYTVTIGLYTAGTDDKPTGSALASTTFLASSLTTTATWYDYEFSTGYAVVAGTKYAIVLSATDGVSGTMVYWRVNTAGTYSRGMKAISADQGVNWTTSSASDFMFKEGQNPPVWYEQYTTGASAASGIMNTSWMSQTFTPVTSHTFNAVSLQLYKAGSPTYTVTISLYATTGDAPTGSALTSTTFLASSLTTTATWYEYQFSTGYSVTAGTKYAIVVSATDGASGAMVYWRVNTAGTYSRGMKAVSADQGTSWTTSSAADFMFKEGGSQ